MLQNFPMVETVWLILEEKTRKLNLYAFEESIHNCRRKDEQGSIGLTVTLISFPSSAK
jgi:hypothetical protein